MLLWAEKSLESAEKPAIVRLFVHEWSSPEKVNWGEKPDEHKNAHSQIINILFRLESFPMYPTLASFATKQRLFYLHKMFLELDVFCFCFFPSREGTCHCLIARISFVFLFFFFPTSFVSDFLGGGRLGQTCSIQM